MSDLHTLLTAALIGTSRTSAPTHANTILSEALNAVTGRDAESTLLARAAIAGLAENAARLAPTNTTPLPEPAPAETLPEAPARAARHLPLVMNTPLLHEWLALCAQAGWRVPPAYLPALLDLARYDTKLRESLRPVLGERGAWLAQFNPEWKFTPAAFSEEAWDESSETGREAIYRTLRRDNPQAARDLLAAQFKTERAASRKRLLSVIDETLHPDDIQLEPLLEETLNDRSSDVQELARHILQRLPASTYNARMAARVKQLVQHEKTGLIGKLTGKKKTNLQPLDAPDPDLKRDGLENSKTPQARLEVILQNTHPDTLMHALTGTPNDLVQLAKQFDALTELEHAAITTIHAPLAQALSAELKNNLGLKRIAAQGHVEPNIRQALKQGDIETLSVLLGDLPTPWPADLSGHLLQALQHSMEKIEHAYAWNPRWRNNLHHQILAYTHPNAPQPSPLPENATDFARQTMNELHATLHVRQQMHRDFTEGTE